MTLYKSLVTPNTAVQGQAGWCLLMSRLVLGAPAGYADATASWNAAKYKHETRELPNVAVPLYFSWVNKIKGDSAYGTNQGHVVVWIPGKGFLSSPGSGFGQKWLASIAEVERYFGCTFRGWTEDINGKRVAQALPNQAPAPTAPQVNTGQGGDFHLVVAVPGYVKAADAAAGTNSNSSVPAGDYKVFNQANGMVNITRDVNQPGWWINPGNNVAPAPAPAAPAPAAFNVGDTVVPTNLVSYDGVPLTQWDSSYTISELIGDRAVLKARGAVWAAMRVSDIRKA